VTLLAFQLLLRYAEIGRSQNEQAQPPKGRGRYTTRGCLSLKHQIYIDNLEVSLYHSAFPKPCSSVQGLHVSVDKMSRWVSHFIVIGSKQPSSDAGGWVYG
jgi:hypothetical protein